MVKSRTMIASSGRARLIKTSANAFAIDRESGDVFRPSRNTDPSFPSDHAAAAFAIAAVVLALRPRLGIATLAAAVAVAYARVYVGLHYPADVAGGALIGVVVALLALGPLRIVAEKLTDLGDAILARLRLRRDAGATA